MVKSNLKVKKNIIVLTLIITTIIIIGSAFLINLEHKESKTTLQLKWIPNAGFAGDFVAKEQGFWEKEGLNVTIRSGGIENSPIQLVAAGSVDFGIATGDQIILARSKGIPVVAIAAVYQENPLVFVSLNSSNITTPKDFIGKKIGLTYTDDEPLYKSLIKEQGIEPKKITEVKVGFDLTPFLGQKIDIYPAFINTQAVDIEENGHKLNVVRLDDYSIHSYSNMYFTTETIIKNEPEKVEHFLHGVIKGWEYSIKNPNETTNIILQYSQGSNFSTTLKSLFATNELVKPNNTSKIGWMNKKTWESTQKVLLDNKIISSAINVDDAFTRKFLNNIYGNDTKK